jgi:hypothetical protein
MGFWTASWFRLTREPDAADAPGDLGRSRLRDPELCPDPTCRGQSRVTNKRNRDDGTIWRRHRCRRCGCCWTSWQSLIDPKTVDPDDIDPALLRP